MNIKMIVKTLLAYGMSLSFIFIGALGIYMNPTAPIIGILLALVGTIALLAFLKFGVAESTPMQTINSDFPETLTVLDNIGSDAE